MHDTSARIILIHGTWGRGFNAPPIEDEPRATRSPGSYWFESTSDFYKGLRQGLADATQKADIRAILWSGENSIDERESAAKRLAADLDASISASPQSRHFVIAHSHAGNVALLARRLMLSDQTHLHIVTLATPFLSIIREAPGWRGKLMTAGLLISMLILAAYVTYSFPPFFALLLLLPLLFRKIGNPLYCWNDSSPPVFRHFGNLKILRSPRDEASLALAAGRVTSGLAHIAGVVSTIVPLLATIAALFLMLLVLLYLYSLYQTYVECVSTGTPCTIPGELGAMVFLYALASVNEAFRFVAVGFGVSAFLIGLSAASKSLFGRELVARSLNVRVEVHDTPDGASDYTIDWCAPIAGNLFGLRHSLYNNPAAISKIVSHIIKVCANADLRDMAYSERPYIVKKRKFLLLTAATLFVVTFYAAAIMIAYAPPGAVGARCALGYYFEPAAPKGGFAVLVARFIADTDPAAQTFIKAIRQTYGLPVIQTCSYVTDNDDDKSSARTLLSRYGASLLISEKRSNDGAAVQFDTPLRPRETMSLTRGSENDAPAGRLITIIARSISDWSHDIQLPLPPDSLADSAAQIERFSSRMDWDTSTPNDGIDAYLRLKAHIDFESGVGRLLTATALTTENSEWAKKAIQHFDRAKALFDASDDLKNMLRMDWTANYDEALLADARFGKSLDSARLAFLAYAKEYDRVYASSGTSAFQVYHAADNAAFAAWTLYELDRSSDELNASSRFACLSLYWLKVSTADYQEKMRRGNALAKQGRVEGLLIEPPPTDKSRAYAVLKAVGKDPSVILAIRSRIDGPDDCKTF